MIEKLTHVKNPLTVIAIFAGLAEVSGTVVLPFLQQETQQIYVWFLMGFPCLLVLLFFVTLLAKHYVLYAPSDFRDDKLFAALFVRGSDALRTQKMKEEETAAEALKEGKVRDQTQGTNSEKEVPKRDVRATAFLAKELLLAKLSKDLNLRFERDVTPRNQPDTMFDAVAIAPGRTLAIEARYTRTGVYPRELLTRIFNRVQSFVTTLPDGVRPNFQFVFAIAANVDNLAQVDRLKKQIERIAEEYPFNTQINIFNFSELEKEFDTR